MEIDIISAMYITFYVLGIINGFIVGYIVHYLLTAKKLQNKVIVEPEPEEIAADGEEL